MNNQQSQCSKPNINQSPRSQISIQKQQRKFRTLVFQLKDKRKLVGKIVKSLGRSQNLTNRNIHDKTSNKSIEMTNGDERVGGRSTERRTGLYNMRRIYKQKITKPKRQNSQFEFISSCYDESYDNLKDSKKQWMPNANKFQQGSRYSLSIDEKSISNHVKNQINQSSFIENPQIFQHSPQRIFNYLSQLPQFINHSSDPKAIYEFFSSLCIYFGIYHKSYLIKKYKNSVYFGQKVPQIPESYTGFTWHDNYILYYGQFMNGKRQGKGIQIDLMKKQYSKGQFLNSKKNGYFEITNPSLIFCGKMKNQLFHGQGFLKTESSVYKGNFQYGMKNGFGQQTFQQQGILYKGSYIDNKFQGKGQLTKRSYRYKGCFVNNKPHGQGYERTNELEYNGEFKNGKKQGKGVLKLKNGVMVEGIFKQNQLVGQKLKQEQNLSFRIKKKKKGNKLENVIMENREEEQLKMLSEESEGEEDEDEVKEKERFIDVTDSNDEQQPLQYKIV